MVREQTVFVYGVCLTDSLMASRVSSVVLIVFFYLSIYLFIYFGIFVMVLCGFLLSQMMVVVPMSFLPSRINPFST